MTPKQQKEYNRRKSIYQSSDASDEDRELALTRLDIEFGLSDKYTNILKQIEESSADIDDIN